jgi:hypothetical protein
MANKELMLREDVEIFDMLERYAGWLVVAGLIIEFSYAFWFREGVSFFERWGPTIANGAVGGGVWLEIHFAGRAKEATSELDRLSAEKVSAANERAANAERETANQRHGTVLSDYADTVSRFVRYVKYIITE